MAVAVPAGTMWVGKEGRVFVKCINHEAYGTRWVRRAWLVWWRYRKQKVVRGLVLHHKDDAKSRDVIANLQLMTVAAHVKLHNARGDSGPTSWTSEGRSSQRAIAKVQYAAGRIGVATWTEETYRKLSAHAKAQHAAGNFGTATWTTESRQKQRVAHLGNTNSLGCKRTPEAIEATRQANLGSKHTAKSLRLMCTSQIERRRREREERIDDYFSTPNRKTQPLENFLPTKGHLTKCTR